MSQREWAEKDYYKDLGVSSTASDEEIKKAYRKLARDNHPDSHPGDTAAEERFKQISEAYSVIGDEKKRKEYDELRTALASGGPFMNFGGRSGFRTSGGFGGGQFGGAGFSDMAGDFGASVTDFLSNFMGQGGKSAGGSGGPGFGSFGTSYGGFRRRQTKGADARTEITIDFREAVLGTTVPLRITNDVACEACHGSGSTDGHSPAKCGRCHGRGFIDLDDSAFGRSAPCPDCDGKGEVITHPCSECQGTGITKKSRVITIRIPAGCEDGQVITATGQGGAGLRGAPAGDLHVTVHVREDSRFSRRGDDLTLTVPVSFTELVLGATITVPTVDGHARVRISPGTDDGQTLRLRGFGIAKPSGAKGDLLVTLKVKVPKNLDDGALAALQAYAAEEERVGIDPRADFA